MVGRLICVWLRVYYLHSVCLSHCCLGRSQSACRRNAHFLLFIVRFFFVCLVVLCVQFSTTARETSEKCSLFIRGSGVFMQHSMQRPHPLTHTHSYRRARTRKPLPAATVCNNKCVAPAQCEILGMFAFAKSVYPH